MGNFVVCNVSAYQEYMVLSHWIKRSAESWHMEKNWLRNDKLKVVMMGVNVMKNIFSIWYICLGFIDIIFKSLIYIILINTHVNYNLQFNIYYLLSFIVFLFDFCIKLSTIFSLCNNTEIYTIVIVSHPFNISFQYRQTGEMIKYWRK